MCYFKAVFGVKKVNFTDMELKALRPMIRVDATSVAPVSKYAREQTMTGLFERGVIDFEEYVGSLDDDSSIPKARLMDIIKQRKEKVNEPTERN